MIFKYGLSKTGSDKYRMNTGRRIANPKAKQLAGTYRTDRHGSIAPLVASASSLPPIAPAYLSVAARTVWDEELPRVIGSGVTDADTSMFARYCEMHAAFVAYTQAGELPKSALLTELRRSAECLGICGPKSRLAKLGSTDQPKAKFTLMPK